MKREHSSEYNGKLIKKHICLLLALGCILILTSCGNVADTLSGLDGQTAAEIAQQVKDATEDVIADASGENESENADDSAENAKEKVAPDPANNLSIFPTPPPVEDVKEWVEYENEDGTYTKGSELIEQAKEKEAEENQLKESDLENIPAVATEDALAYATKSVGRYYYELLTEADKLLYGEIFYVIDNMLENVKLSSLDEKNIERVFNYVINDHPEIFFTEGFSYTKYAIGDELKHIALSGTYNMQPNEREINQTYVDAYVNAFMGIYNSVYPGGTDDYHKVKFTYEYLISGTEYKMNAVNNQNILSVMMSHYSVCQGYAKATQYLLDKLGIKATVVTGTGKGGEPHAWNLVLADGEYYYVDTTWGDASYTISGDQADLMNSVPPVNYDYLLVTTDSILKNHTIKDPSIMPNCTSMYDNYYVRENLLFTDVNEEQLRAVFDKGYAQGMEYITLKMINNEAYDQMWKYLFEDQNIFSYLAEGKTTISYAESKDALYLVLWI